MEGSLGMKHFFRFFAAAACTVLLLALCACAPDGTSSPVSSSATEGVSSESTAQSIPAPESASGEGAQALSLLPADAANIQPDAVPEFLTADQQELYRAAYYLYYRFDVSSGFAFDTIDENSPFIVGDTGRSYYQDTGFANYSAFRTALDCVFTSNFADSLIDKYQNYIKGDDGSLSQGEKQLLCIARLMLALPPMLILDEATSSIDTRTEMKIQEAFQTMMEGRTTFVVAHRLSTIREADVILYMQDGKVLEQGNHQELLEKNGYYAKLYRSQFVCGK